MITINCLEVVILDRIQWEEYYFNEPPVVNVSRIESQIPLSL